jgi:hypothetical protein
MALRRRLRSAILPIDRRLPLNIQAFKVWSLTVALAVSEPGATVKSISIFADDLAALLDSDAIRVVVNFD